MAKNVVKWVTTQGKRNWVLGIVIISKPEEYPSIISNKIKCSCWFLRMYLNQSREHMGVPICTMDILLQVLGMTLTDALLGFFFWLHNRTSLLMLWCIFWHLVIGYRFPTLILGFYLFIFVFSYTASQTTYLFPFQSLLYKSWLNSCHFPLGGKKK